MVLPMMAAQSDGGINMVEEQPIDLSKVPKKPMPPLIPISLLRSGYHQPPRVLQDPQRRREKWRDDTGEDEDIVLSEVSRKRVRQHEIEGWSPHKLDRARSVPQLTPLSTLQRNKSMSESRIPAATAEVTGSFESEEQLRAAIEMLDRLNQRRPSQMNDGLLQSSWVYIGYYSQLLHRFQAQEMLRQVALHQHDEQGGESGSCPPTSEGVVGGDGGILPSDDAELKRRQTRPLTGKHVRPGTGASPATLLSLRRKIQARRQHHDDTQTS